MRTIDILVQNYFSANRTEGLTNFFYIFTTLFDFTIYFIFISLCVAGLIYLVRNIKYAIFFLSTLFVSAVIVYLMKLFFDVARPAGGLFSAFGQSFPSYHATEATVFFVLVMFVFNDYWGRYSKVMFNFLCILAIFLVAISRVYLGVHWFSDVFWGVVLGSVISYIAIFSFKSVIKVQSHRL